MSNELPRQPLPPAGWYDDQHDETIKRYWDGAAWTQHTAPREAPPAPSAPPAVSTDLKRRFPRWALWTSIGAGVLVLLIIFASIGRNSTTVTNASEARPAAPTVTVTAEPFVTPAPTETPAPVPTESAPIVAPAPVDDSAARQAFAYDAHANVADFNKDLDDIVTTLNENGVWRLLSNGVELSFNLGQLQGLAAPSEVSVDWAGSLGAIDADITAYNSALSDERYADMYGIVESLRADAAAADSIASRIG